jgi:hypothetical protein
MISLAETIFSEYGTNQAGNLSAYDESIIQHGNAFCDFLLSNLHEIDKLKAHKGYADKDNQILRLKAKLDDFKDE